MRFGVLKNILGDCPSGGMSDTLHLHHTILRLRLRVSVIFFISDKVKCTEQPSVFSTICLEVVRDVTPPLFPRLRSFNHGVAAQSTALGEEWNDRAISLGFRQPKSCTKQ